MDVTGRRSEFRRENLNTNQYPQNNPFAACIELSKYARLVGVAFRILADGTVETDSVEEAMKVRAAFLKEARKQGAPDRNISNNDEFSEDTKRFLYVLAAGGSYSSDEIAEEAKISKKSIPPLIRGLNSWANRRGLNLDDLLVRTQKSVKGKPVSTYRLTEEACERFGIKSQQITPRKELNVMSEQRPAGMPDAHTILIDGLEVTRLQTGASRFKCPSHGATVTASLNAAGVWKIFAACKSCDQVILEPILDAIEAAKPRTQNRAPIPQDEMQHGAPIPVPIPANLRR
jgi:hypothetical protein